MTAVAIIAHSPLQAQLLAAAARPLEPLTFAYAGVLSRFGTLALPAQQLRQLFECHFPHATQLLTQFGDSLPTRLQRRADEVEDVRDLLFEYRSDEGADSRWLAHAMAVGCLGDDHLWQDLGLPHRQALSQLLRDHFALLHARNSGDMRWKKFFYKQLCEKEEINICKAPSCAECVDYPICFSPE